MRSLRTVLGAAAVFVLCLLTAVSGAASAQAKGHAKLISTAPVSGASVSRAPEAVQLTFDGNVISLGLQFQVIGPPGLVTQGKPVVCTPVAEMVPYRGHLYLADGPEQFLAQLDRALAEDDPQAVQRRVAMARFNSWDDRIDVLETIVVTAAPTGGRAGGRAGRAAPTGGAAPTAGTTPADAAVRAELQAVRTRLDSLNRTRAVRGIRRYWSARQAFDRRIERAGRAVRRMRRG